MNLMRRDNPAIPEDYYLNNFISGLSPYIQRHLECLKPKDMQSAIWYARRVEKASLAQQQKLYTPQVRTQVIFDQPKQPIVPTVAPPPTNRNAIIEQAKLNQVCYKCREPWVPGHRQVCKVSQKA
ncbi:unnamed protein product [Triticum turgidum subsp. durum]|uniref:Uncharacterized protein n=1 Tax=Triticum turgidum subsp. durum TaxID=4567 RepID=A0A9R0TT55_TRITD|nr:unnamed protein product [Triticum turgidum subsp. durum]